MRTDEPHFPPPPWGRALGWGVAAGGLVWTLLWIAVAERPAQLDEPLVLRFARQALDHGPRTALAVGLATAAWVHLRPP
ncbi:MAG: hypothetical protein GC161_04630 [Planctomycetaceae bacterium]|nr:hypothetical protein [Planctomycetaceae bacterium]